MPSNFNPKVSIIIPVYNGFNYLREAIDSALSQTYKNIEIIVVNDGSTDDGATERVAKSYGNKIRYFSKENGGTSTALNVGIRNMKGTYFSWLSHDDQYYPKKIQRQIEELGKLKNKNTIMMTDLDGINEKYEEIYKTNYIEHIKQYPLRAKSYIHPIVYNQTHGCTLLIPKVCFDDLGLFNEKEKVAQDFEFFYKAFQKYPHKLISEVLVTARDSSNRQGRRSKAKGNEEYSRLYIKIIKNLSEEDYKLLAPSKIDFYEDMEEFFFYAGYTYALEYVRSLYQRNLQISSYDVVGNKFNGHDLHFYLREQGIGSKQIVLIKESNDKNTIAFDFFARDSMKRLTMKKEFYSADLVHLHLVHNIFDLTYLPLMSRLKPMVITLHDPFFLSGHCVHHFDCNKWQTHCADCPYLDTLFPIDKDYSSLNFEIKKQAIQSSQISAIVASKWMENKVRKSPIWNGKKIYLLPFGINQELFKPGDCKKARRKLGIEENNLVLMVRTNKGPFKGVDILKNTLKRIESSKTISIITIDEKGLLNKLGDRYDIHDYGWIKDDKLLVTLYQACDIFLMPSRQETFGMMAIEAMSCGKLVLAINSEGSALSEIIKSPEYGIAVGEEKYFEELQRLIGNPKEIINRGKKSQEYAKKVYSKDSYMKGILNIYKEVIKNHQLDSTSQLIIDQFKEHLIDGLAFPNEIGNTPKPPRKLNKYWREDSISRKIYREFIPLGIRKAFGFIFSKGFDSVEKYLPKKYKRNKK